jgi:Replication-relaxation
VLARLDRVIGGVRAGSTGWVYSLGPAGQRLIQLDANQRGTARIRKPWTPSTMFLRHSLDVAEVYVQLVEAARRRDFTLTTFETEPACWWPDGLGSWLKPDALVVLSTAAYDELVWLEIDRGTESLPTMKRKLTAYTDFVRRGQLGPSDVTPHVVISTPTERRRDALRVIAEAIDPTGDIFQVCQFAAITQHLIEMATGNSNAPP